MTAGKTIQPLYSIMDRVLEDDEKTSSIRFEVEAKKEHIVGFAKTVGFKGQGIPPTYFTFFRWAEFRWLSRLGIPLETVVHTEQAYEYHDKGEAGVTFTVETQVSQFRERRGLKMVTMTTRISVGNRLVVTSVASFLAKGVPA